MLRVLRRVAGPASDDVIVKLVAQSEKRARRDSEHCVVEDSPFRRVTWLYWERSTLEWHRCGRVRLGIRHVHVKRLSRSVDRIVKFVRPCADDLLEIVVSELAVVKCIVAGVYGILFDSAKSTESSQSRWVGSRDLFAKAPRRCH